MPIKHLRYIDGIKGLTCFFIMLGHYSGLYKYAENNAAIDILLLHHIPSVFSFFLAEGIWVRLFYIISGYLLSKSSIKTVPDLIRKTMLRFFRLAIPILGASLIILFIASTAGMQNTSIQKYVSNSWLAEYYSIPLSLYDALLEPVRVLLFKQGIFNGVWWVLTDMFFASIIVYAVNYLRYLFSEKVIGKVVVGIIYLALISFFVLKRNSRISGVLAGAIFGRCDGWIDKKLKKNDWFFWPMFFAPMLLYNILRYIPSLIRPVLIDLTFVCFIIAVSHLKIINELFSRLDSLGRISFGIYSLHWPVFCSLGIMIIIKGINSFSGFDIYLISILFSVIMTIVLSVIYNITVEQWSNQACYQINNYLQNIIDKQ